MICARCKDDEREKHGRFVCPQINCTWCYGSGTVRSSIDYLQPHCPCRFDEDYPINPAFIKLAKQKLADALLGICWGMASDDLHALYADSLFPPRLTPEVVDALDREEIDSIKRTARWERYGYYVRNWAGTWLLEQTRPKGCYAPWEENKK